MKLYITIFVLAINLMLLACKKERTCSCKTTQTLTSTTTPRGGPSATTTTSSDDNQTEYTYSKVKKDDLERLFDCNSKSYTSSDSYTTTVSVSTLTSSGTFTYYTYTNYTADVVQTRNSESTCEIK